MNAFRTVGVVTVGAALALGAIGCSGESSGASTQAPARTVLAVSRWWVGDTDRQGTSSSSAWKSIGFDLDTTSSTTSRTGSCRAIADGVVVLDGVEGIDNSFGQNVVLALAKVVNDASEPSSSASAAVRAGKPTLLLDVSDLAAATPALGLFVSAPFGATGAASPRWDGSDAWPVDPRSLAGATVSEGPKLRLAVASSDANATLARGDGTIEVPLMIGANVLRLPLRNVTVRIYAAEAGAAVEGTLGGVVAIDELVRAVEGFVAQSSPSFCTPSTTLTQVRSILRSNADFRLAGNDSAQDCDALTVGLAFSAQAVAAPSAVGSAPSPQAPCP